MTESIYIFTDGSSRGNPGPGGWGAILIGKFGSFEVKELGGGEAHTTNNRMELSAAIRALSFATSQLQNFSTSKLVIYTDSGYLVEGITKWIHNWQKRRWKTADKKPVLNRDLWEELYGLADGKKIEWKHIRGHVGVAGNERCDEIATSFADGESPKLYSGVLQNYGIKNILNVARG